MIDIRAVVQESEGSIRHLRGKAEIETADMLLQADEMDYNEETGEAVARGHVYFKNFDRNEELRCDHGTYNMQTESGKFYDVSGSGSPRIDARPGLLTTANPVYFQGVWAEKIKEKIILYDGFVTNCRVPNPWWTLRGPKFDIIPEDRVIAYRSLFRVKFLPIFFAPVFYKSLEKAPRRSGFLTPNFGNSSRRGYMFGLGYYWAINRSYDATYRIQEFTARGTAHHLELRGKPRKGMDFDSILYGVADRGLKIEGQPERIKQGGFSVYTSAQADLGHGFQGRATINYLSSLLFRQAFTESFNEAIFSEVNSVGFVTRHWDTWTLNVVFARLENFQSIQKGDSIQIRKLPEVQFQSRERQISDKVLPVWFSFESSAGLLRRTQPLFQTRQFMQRADVAPRVSTALRWKEFHLIPSFRFHGTQYGETQDRGRVIGANYFRKAGEVNVDLVMPSLERTFDTKNWLGDKLKHVIEPRASFRHVRGIEDFSSLIRFDETELLSNTTETEVSLTNRLFSKRKGNVNETLSWQVWQRFYHDPTFGGAITPESRNVVLSSVNLTPYAFLDGARRYSPIVSVLRGSPIPGFSAEWRTDYDPKRGGIVNSGITANMRRSKFFMSAGHNQVRSRSLLSPNANQLLGLVGVGDPNRRGWNAGFSSVYDFRTGILQYANTQVTYNTDCCGLSVQYRRFSFGTRNENQFRVQFSVANIGSFGTLRKQDRLF